MQKSLFVIPHECRAEIEFIAGIYSVISYMRFIETVKIDGDFDLREYFSV